MRENVWPLAGRHGRDIPLYSHLAAPLLPLHPTDTLAFLHHADYSSRRRRSLATGYVLLPASHIYKPFGCPVSSAFRVETSFVPSPSFLRDNEQGNHWGAQPTWPNRSTLAYDGITQTTTDRAERLFLSECSCSFLRMC